MQKRRQTTARRSIGLIIGLVAPMILFALSCALDDEPARSTPTNRSKENKLGDVNEVEQYLAGGLIGSKHDFTQFGSQPRDLCTPCHMPHIEDARAPLLDKRPAAGDRLRPYETIGVELDGASLLCLSCHDGVIATDVYTASHGVRIAQQLGTSHLGSAGAYGHPIGIRYPTNDPKYKPIASFAGGSIPLPDGRVQCISCHDPHNTERHAGMLNLSNKGSQLCLSCHRL